MKTDKKSAKLRDIALRKLQNEWQELQYQDAKKRFRCKESQGVINGKRRDWILVILTTDNSTSEESDRMMKALWSKDYNVSLYVLDEYSLIPTFKILIDTPF